MEERDLTCPWVGNTRSASVHEGQNIRTGLIIQYKNWSGRYKTSLVIPAGGLILPPPLCIVEQIRAVVYTAPLINSQQSLLIPGRHGRRVNFLLGGWTAVLAVGYRDGLAGKGLVGRRGKQVLQRYSVPSCVLRGGRAVSQRCRKPALPRDTLDGQLIENLLWRPAESVGGGRFEEGKEGE
ncbi:hypothetical protein XELAEV_18040899mg [Xenopus laevis]|uniref:Uncharacterized protein n=1 Tax=Xenopus laevis TaxID=8355 RepID=A0A974H987_XENLA|nr:hypothetical protein XELAEV_18040899mg [Xenopus laevis]